MPGCGQLIEFIDLARGIARLPPKHREAVELYFLSGGAPTQSQVAYAMQLNQQRVSELLREAREMIAGALVPVERCSSTSSASVSCSAKRGR